MSTPTRETAPLAGSARSAQVNVSFPKMDIFVKFEIWNVSKKTFEPVGNMHVDLMDDDPHFDDEIDTQVTDANGFIHFSVTESDLKEKSGEDKPDLYFKARPGGLVAGGVSLPDEWSTKTWKDKYGKPGFFPNTPFAAGGSLAGASAADPLVYRIGLDYHARFQFVVPGIAAPQRAPKGLEADILRPSPSRQHHPQRTDRNGELHGVVFDVSGGETVSFHVSFNVEDPDIKLPRSTVRLDIDDINHWYTSREDADQKVFNAASSTSLGTQNNPVEITASLDRRNVALFFLTMLYEHASFFHITEGAWTGVENLRFFTTTERYGLFLAGGRSEHTKFELVGTRDSHSRALPSSDVEGSWHILVGHCWFGSRRAWSLPHTL